MYVLLVYDILDDGRTGQRVLRKIFKKCKQYLHPIQKSVFEGELSYANLEKLKFSLKKIIRKDKDSLIVFIARNEKWLHKESLGVDGRGDFNFL